MALITLFTAPKPFTNPHIALIQRNAIRSWIALGPEVEVIMVGEEAGLAEAAAELGVLHLPQVARNEKGTPLVSSIFQLAREASGSPLLCYLNADILLMPDLIRAARDLQSQRERFLAVGQRWDLDVTQPLDFTGEWAAQLNADTSARGKLHPPAGSDYFLFPRSCFQDIPPFAIGRAGWDNWMIYWARREGWPVVDATAAVRIVHQNHDYSHLPGGQPHYRLPETDENVRLAGGRMVTRFTLADCDWRLQDSRLEPIPSKSRKLVREVEIFPLVRLRSRVLGWLSYALFHPKRAYWEARVWASRTLKKKKSE